MKASEMTERQLRACNLRCPIKLPCGGGRVTVKPESGWWFCHPAKTEVTKKYWKAAKEDLRLRRMRLKTATDEYHGEFGRVKIGGKMFSFFPTSGMLVRDDFADWCERHIDEVWDTKFNRERMPEKDESGEEVKVKDDLKMYKEIRKRALAMHNIGGISYPGTGSSMYDMEYEMGNLDAQVRGMERLETVYAGTKILRDLLGTEIAYKKKRYADAIEMLMNIAACALKSAQYVQKMAEYEKNDYADFKS